MIISYLLQAQHETELAAAAKRCPMALVDEVRRELENDKKRGGRFFKKWLDGSCILRAIARRTALYRIARRRSEVAARMRF
jgi:hypothetical protein